jgi:hypothetical protein
MEHVTLLKNVPAKEELMLEAVPLDLVPAVHLQ